MGNTEWIRVPTVTSVFSHEGCSIGLGSGPAYLVPEIMVSATTANLHQRHAGLVGPRVTSNRKASQSIVSSALAEFRRNNPVASNGWTPSLADRLRGWLLDHAPDRRGEARAVAAVPRWNLVRELDVVQLDPAALVRVADRLRMEEGLADDLIQSAIDTWLAELGRRRPLAHGRQRVTKAATAISATPATAANADRWSGVMFFADRLKSTGREGPRMELVRVGGTMFGIATVNLSLWEAYHASRMLRMDYVRVSGRKYFAQYNWRFREGLALARWLSSETGATYRVLYPKERFRKLSLFFTNPVSKEPLELHRAVDPKESVPT